MKVYECLVCGRATAHADQICGPHRLRPPKPVNWWAGFEEEMKALGAGAEEE